MIPRKKQRYESNDHCRQELLPNIYGAVVFRKLQKRTLITLFYGRICQQTKRSWFRGLSPKKLSKSKMPSLKC